MLEEFINNDKYLVKIGFGEWGVLRNPVKFTLACTVQIKLRCFHKNYRNDDGCNYCTDCDEFLKVTSG